FVRPLRGAELAEDELASALAEVFGKGAIDKTAPHERGQFVPIGDDDRRTLGKHLLDDVTKVPRVGAERNRRAVGGRLNHVLAATTPQAAPDKGDRRASPPGPKLADRVDEQDARG